MARFVQCVARWCRSHRDPVTIVFDRPVPERVFALAGGNLVVVAAQRAGRNAADDTVVSLAQDDADRDRDEGDNAGDNHGDGDGKEGDDGHADRSVGTPRLIVVTSDRGLRARLPPTCEIWGVGRFRDRIGY